MWNATFELKVEPKSNLRLFQSQIRQTQRKHTKGNTPDEKQKKFPRNGRRIERELGPVPTLFKSKIADQLAWCNNKCIISMQGFVWVIFFIKAKQAFCYPALLTVDGWFHFFSSKGLGKSQFTSILLTEARICLCNLRMYGHAPLLMGT